MSRPSRWISAWFILTTIVVILDACYCFSRPKSFEGGEWDGWFWKATGHHGYAKIDHIYGPQAYYAGNGFTNAQALLNLFEATGNLVYLYMTEISGNPIAPLFGFGASLATCTKTILYEAQEYFCNYCSIGHNNLRDAIMFYVVPTNTWIIIPGVVAWALGKELASALRTTGRMNSQVSSKKKVH